MCLVSPETATASALTGVITDPRDPRIPYQRIADPDEPIINREMFVPPLPREMALQVDLVKGPNIASLPTFEPLPDSIEVPVLLKVANDVSTDDLCRLARGCCRSGAIFPRSPTSLSTCSIPPTPREPSR